jgi:predicted dehydrogenase
MSYATRHPHTENRIRLGVIGAWGHFVHVLDEVENMPDVEIVGLAPGMEGEDFSTVKAKYSKAAEAPVYEDHLKLLREQHPDAVTVSTRLDQISELAIDAANAGCHLVSEKPLAITHKGLQRLWDAVTENQVECLAMLNNPAHPILAAARQAVADGLIGEISLLNARKSYRFGNRAEWFGEREIYGGTIPWIGIHALDFISTVADSLFTTVAAMHANTAHPDWPECEDACTMTLQLENDAIATASVDYLRPMGTKTHGDDWIRIVGSKGIIEAGMDRKSCTIVTQEEPERELTPITGLSFYAPFLRQLATSDHDRPLAATKRSFALAATALHARDAADRQSAVAIPPSPWDGCRKEHQEKDR